MRDGEILIIDAINYASFMRSSIAAHKSDNRLISVLSIYDVAKVQFLAGRLILEKMAFWRFGERTGARRGRRSESNPRPTFVSLRFIHLRNNQPFRTNED